MLDTRRIVLTGGPGAGKTSVLRRLQELGYSVVPEVARQIIADRLAKGLSPRPSPVEFAQAIMAKDIEQYESASAELIFFDRSILDSLGMLHACGELSEQQRAEILAKFSYSSPVFVFPPWAAIYQQDSERDQTFDESVRVHASLASWYLECGYAVAEVPFGSIDERCEHILRTVGQQ